MQRRPVEMVRSLEEGGGDDAAKAGGKADLRDVRSVFPSHASKQLVREATKLGLLRDTKTFVSAATSSEDAAVVEPPSTEHFDGSSSLAEVLLRQRAEKQEAREQALKAMKVQRPLDDAEVEFLDDIEVSKREMDKKIAQQESEQLAEFNRAQRGTVRCAEDSQVLRRAIPSRVKTAGGSDEDGNKTAPLKRQKVSDVLKQRLKSKKHQTAIRDDDGDDDSRRGGGDPSETVNLFGCYGEDSP
jgi:hypothetical protein